MLPNALRWCSAPARSAARLRWAVVLAGVILSLLLPAGAALAAPVAPGPVHLTQPDGTAIAASPYGDEWASGYEHQGHTILLDPDTGYWVYAMPGPGGRLVPGSNRAGLDPLPAGLPPGLRDRPPAPEGLPEASFAAPAVWPGALGTQRVLVLLVDFTPSASRGTTQAQWSQLFFDATPGAKSVANWYGQASFGNFALAPAAETYGTANDGVVAVTLGYAHPDPYPPGQANQLISYNALVAADPYVNFAAFDTNLNGGLDVAELHIMVIVRGFEKAYGGTAGSCSPSVWGHRSALSSNPSPPQLDGTWVAASAYGGGYAQEGEWHEFLTDGCDGGAPGHMATGGILVHEMGHDVDWPDLYDTDGSSEGVGNWSVMGSGSWGRASGGEYQGATPVLADAFLKWYQHWLTPVPVTTPLVGVAVPNSAQNPVAYLVGANLGGIDWDFGSSSGSGEYFLVENRQLAGFDAGLWAIDSAGNAKGCIIWHVDETRTYTNSANADETRKLVDVEEADGPPQDLDLPSGGGGNRGDAGDPWPGSAGETAFGPSSNPDSQWYGGTASGVAVTGISTAGTGCTLSFSGVGPTWDGSEGTSWSAAGNWTVGRVPGQNDNTVIPGGVPNWPSLDAAASVLGLTILDGAHLGVSADVTLDVYGDWAELGSGYLNANAGTVVFRGSAAQSITTGAASQFHHLQIGSGSSWQTVTAGSDLDVNGDLTVQPGARLALGSHTLRLAGNWTDNPQSFAPGSSTVLLDGTAQAVQRAASEATVYANDLTSTTGWAVQDANGDSTTWFATTSTALPNSPDHGQHARYQWHTTNAADDWLFSPGVALQAGVAYTVRFNYGARSAAYPERLAVYIGTAQAAAAMATQLFDNDNVVNTVWQQGSGSFTPGSSGTYYVGFYCHSAADMYNLAVDDLVVAASEPNLSFYNLSVAGGSTAALADDAAVQNNLAVSAGGTLALATHALTVEGSVTNDGALAQTMEAPAASTAHFLRLRNAAGTSDKYLGADLTPESGLGTTTVTVYGNQSCPGPEWGSPPILRCFEVDPATPAAATLRLYYLSAELNGNDPQAAIICHRAGEVWEEEPGDHTREADGGTYDWVQVTSVDQYSPFAAGDPGPTLVELGSFTASPAPGRVHVAWATLSEVDAVGFNLWRRQGTQDTYQKINTQLIPARGGPTQPADYSFEDRAVASGVTYYYKLEGVDVHGGSAFFGPVWATAGRARIFVPLAAR